MLPSPPKSLGMLGDVLTSALDSTLGRTNNLGLSQKNSVCVVLVDGLGAHNLKESGAHAGFLNSQQSTPASCYFPSTTSASIVAFATGKAPWESGFIGYQVFDRTSGTAMNLLTGWESQEHARQFQFLETVSESALKQGVEFHVVAPSLYEDSGFTEATMRGVKFHGQNEISKRFEKASSLLADKSKNLVYLYVPELDQVAHSQGWKSDRWLELLEDVDSEVRHLATALPKSAGLVLTADHGVLDIPKVNHIYIDDFIAAEDLVFVGGDTRGLFLYLKDTGQKLAVIETLTRSLGSSCYILTPDQIVEAGYWKEVSRNYLLPEIVVLAKKEVALYHRAFAKAKSLEMIGHHGSISGNEMSIPLIRIGF
jgi:predicted AlkP superfamily pyrophosphatase or phosphodiesterase